MRCWATRLAISHTWRVVDRVLDPVGERGVALADVEPQVEQQPLADLALGRGHPDVRVQRQPADLDRDLWLGVPLLVLVLVYVVELVGVVVVHGATVAAATASASWTGATS